MSVRTDEVTETFEAPAGAPTESLAPGFQIAQPKFDEELRVLLRSRLILVHALGLAVGAIFAVMLFTVSSRTDSMYHRSVWTELWQWTAFLESLVGILVLLRFVGMSFQRLRALEITFLAVHAAYFGHERIEMLASLPQSAPHDLIGYLGLASLQGFIILVLVYGVLIPNTRRRCLMVTAGLTAVPFVIVPAVAALNPVLREGHVIPLLVQCAYVLTVPAAIAVFAAARAIALQRRAFEAERRAEQIGQYALKHKLGEGGMGEVWLAEHGLLKRPCAVKFIRHDRAGHPATAVRFEREVRAVTGLSHPNTVRVYDYGRADDGSFYYVMEYLNGPTLEEMVRGSGPLPPRRAVFLLRQLCGALAEAHAAGLVHRDLKPGNVIVTDVGGQRDVAKLLDFGLVQDLSMDADHRLTRTGTILGTPAYMSPEQASGESAVDARGDVYSLGAVAFFVLTGRPPFLAKGLGQLLSAHRMDAPPPVTDLQPDVPADLAAVVARCLEKSPEDRFSSTTELEQALAECDCAIDETKSG